MRATLKLLDHGQSVWLDQHHARAAHRRHVAPLHRGSVGHRPDLQPDHLRSRDPQQRRRTTRRSAPARTKAARRAAVLRAGHRGHHPGGRPVRARLSAHLRRRRLGVAGGFAAAGPRYRRPRWRQARQLHARAARSNLFIKIPGTAEGLPRDRGGHLTPACRSTSRCCSRREQYLAAAEAYLRGIERRIGPGLRSATWLGGLAVRQPLGCGRGGQGAPRSCATGSASRSACAPTGPTASCCGSPR